VLDLGACVVQISPYFVGEYGFPETCKAVAWSGDNPCAVAGMRLENAGDACISLGTSDTIFALLDEPSPKIEGHIFGSPVDPAGYMALICFLNGSLVRERVREKVGAADWAAFGEMLKETSAGNSGSIAFHYDDPEITPHVPNAVEAFYNGEDEPVDSLTPAEEARAVIEARFISMRVHAEFIGLKMDRIYATGGASQNNDITQVIADVFGCDVYTMASPGGAPLGAAYRALHAVKCEEAGEYVSFLRRCVVSCYPYACFCSASWICHVSSVLTTMEMRQVPYGQTLRDAEAADAEPHVSIAATPDVDRHATYSAMVPRFAELEQNVIASCK
jgi:xylulokinase